MTVTTVLNRYDLIIKMLQKAPATFDEISDYLNFQSNFDDKDFCISKRTLQRDINEIYRQFGMEIKNNRKAGNKYYIAESPEQEVQNNRLIECYQINRAINLAKQIDGLVFFESRRPSGIEHINQLVYSIKYKRVTKFSHQKNYETNYTIREVHPLALKESTGIWYLLAVDLKDKKLKSFGLDRMKEVEILSKSFREKYNYNFESLYKNSFGIIALENTEPSFVQLQFNYEQGMYTKNFPLHHSQSLIKENKTHIVYEFTIFPTYDFIMEILKYGKEVKVLQPLSLANEVKSILTQSIRQYV